MLTGNYTSVYEIIERVFDTFDSEEIEFSVLIRHISDILLLIGTSSQLTNEIGEITVSEYRGALPQNMVYINQIRDCGTNKALRYSGNSFNSALNPDSPDRFVDSDLTYTLNNSYIFTNFEEGTIQIAYKALPVDDKGFPLIPDDIKFKKAVESYLLERIGFKLFLKEKLSRDRYKLLATEKDWYVGAAQSKGKLPSVDKMETIKNAFSRMLIMPLAHSTFFTSVTSPETLTIHPINR